MSRIDSMSPPRFYIIRIEHSVILYRLVCNARSPTAPGLAGGEVVGNESLFWVGAISAIILEARTLCAKKIR